ncbi:MAG: CDP-glycerol glycerophosphotransferase family protein [Lachnospiraceae bacterium]
MNQIIDKKLMVFESTPDFSDNSRGLWEYVFENTDYRTFWVIKDKKVLELLKKKGVNCELEGSQSANEMIAKARFLITTSFNFTYQKTIGQIHISAWHGFPLKLIGFFNSAASNSDSFEMLKIITTQSDMIAVTSRLSQLTVSGMFAVDPRKVKETGYPRNDIMLKVNGKAELKKITSIDVQTCKLILYLPTMRKGLKEEGGQFQNNVFNYSDFDADLIDQFLEKNNAYMFTKLHFADNEYFTKGNFKLPKRMVFLDTNILNEKLLTIYHIMNAFDMLITDYSSVYVDFMLLDKPIIFSCPDLSKYQEDRGFIVDDPTLLMPGVIVEKQCELLEAVKDVFEGKDSTKADRESTMAFFHRYRDMDSSKRLFEAMMDVDENGIEDSSKMIGRHFYIEDSPLYQYTQSITTELYFDTGRGFLDENKIEKKRDLLSINYAVSLEHKIPEHSRSIRFDPDDTGRYALRKFTVKVDGIRTEYEIIRGFQIDDCVYFYGQDPQIIISLNDDQHKEISIEFECVNLYSNAGRIIEILNKKLVNITNKLKNVNEELLAISTSNSWRITKPLRNMGRIVRDITKKF